MGVDRADGGINTGQQALRLTHRIPEQNAGPPGLLISTPPGVDLIEYRARRQPAINRQAKSGFSNECVATHRLKCRASRIRSELIVARDHPDFALMFQTYLRRPQHVTGWVE